MITKSKCDKRMQELSRILTKISPEVFTRHYGISNQVNWKNLNISNISIGKIPGNLIYIQVGEKKGDNLIEIFLWENKLPEPSYFPLMEDITFFQTVLNVLKTPPYNEITLIGKIPRNWSITDLKPVKINVTNFHYTIKSEDKTYRLKWYSRPEKGYKEFQIQENLAEFRIAPKTKFLVAYKKKAIFGVYEEILNVRNLDDLTGEMYIELINNKISLDQFFIEIKRIFEAITKLLSRLQKVESSLLDKKLIQPYSYLEWQKDLHDNWNVLERSNLFNHDEKKRINDQYLPLLSRFLETTEPGLIHGDIWMRQFGMSQFSNHLRLFDFEDVRIGPKLYDYASQINSIKQQYEYFRIRNENRNIFSYEYNQTLVETFLSTLTPIFGEVTREIQYNQSLRMIHEIKYLLEHQPEEIWLLSFIKKELVTTFKKLKP